MGIVIRETVINQGDILIFIEDTKGQHTTYKVHSIDKQNRSILLCASQRPLRSIILKMHKEHIDDWYYDLDIRDEKGKVIRTDSIFPLIAKIIY